MAVARQEMNLMELTAQIQDLKDAVSTLHYDVSKLKHIAQTTSRCIKALWMVLAPVATGLLIRWLTLSSAVK